MIQTSSLSLILIALASTAHAQTVSVHNYTAFSQAIYAERLGNEVEEIIIPPYRQQHFYGVAIKVGLDKHKLSPTQCGNVYAIWPEEEGVYFGIQQRKRRGGGLRN